MGGQDLDDDADDAPLGTPLPKDDRLWRHPSELAEVPPVASPDAEPRRASRWRFKRHP